MFYSQTNTLSLKGLLYIYYRYLQKRDQQRDIFYQEVSDYFNTKNVLDFNLARSAFAHIVITQKIKKILMPAFLCSIFEDVLIQKKIKPVFVDIDIETLNIDVLKTQEAMTQDVDAILAVHTFGNPCDLSALIDLKEDYNALLIEDCAHALGAKYKGKLVGTFGDFSIFSMYKYFPTIAGGFLISKNSLTDVKYEKEAFNLKNLLRLLYIIDIFHPIIFRLKESFKNRRLVYESGSMRKAPIERCSDFDLAIFNYFFKTLEEQVSGRNRVGRLFDQKIYSDKIIKQKILTDNISSRQSYPLIVKVPEARDHILKKLRKKGIMADKTWHDAIIFSSRVRRTFKVNVSNYPNAVSAANGIITLPIHSNYNKKDVDFITNNINKELRRL
jgi:dTDP-4-amino-4,6-dideoxygalactose transaminase